MSALTQARTITIHSARSGREAGDRLSLKKLSESVSWRRNTERRSDRALGLAQDVGSCLGLKQFYEMFRLGLPIVKDADVETGHPLGLLLVATTEVAAELAVNVASLQFFLLIVGFSPTAEAKRELDMTAARIQ